MNWIFSIVRRIFLSLVLHDQWTWTCSCQSYQSQIGNGNRYFSSAGQWNSRLQHTLVRNSRKRFKKLSRSFAWCSTTIVEIDQWTNDSHRSFIRKWFESVESKWDFFLHQRNSFFSSLDCSSNNHRHISRFSTRQRQTVQTCPEKFSIRTFE